MRLERPSYPVPDADGWLIIGNGVRVREGPPRELEGSDIPGLYRALEKASASLWGQNWRAPMEEVCGLNRGATREWKRRDQIPPPKILGWIAYLSTQDDRRALGPMLLALARSNDSDTAMSVAVVALADMREKP